MMRRKATAAAAVLAASLAGTAAIPAVAKATPAGDGVTVVQGGLNAPRHLVLTRAGLVVTEAGTVSPVGASNCATGPATEGAGTSQFCSSPTGTIFTIVPKPFASAFGTLRLISHGKTRAVDLAAFAAAHPQTAYSLGTVPGETGYDSDPYDVIAYRGGWVVADAGANDLLYVSATGRVSMLARFPAVAEQVPAGVFGNPAPISVDAQAVPTSVAIGPDGALYVGLLLGVPSDPGTSDIYRVVPGHQPEIWARGLTSVTAIAFDRQGRLLATEFNAGGLLSPPTVPGALVRISDNGQTVTTLPVPGLYQPTGVAVSANGTVYVSIYGDNTTASSQAGEIVKITGLS